MKRGLIKFVFDYGERYVVEIAVPDDQTLQSHKQWSQLRSWWRFDNGQTHYVEWDDGGELLLNRDKILNISMIPRNILEIE